MKRFILGIAMLFMSVTPVLASPAFTNLVAAASTVTSQSEPLGIAFNGYTGERLYIMISANDDYTGYLYEYSNTSLRLTHIIHSSGAISIHSSTTFILILVPDYDQEIITVLVKK